MSEFLEVVGIILFVALIIATGSCEDYPKGLCYSIDGKEQCFKIASESKK